MGASSASQADDIVSWLKKKTSPPAIEVTSAQQAKEVIAAHSVVVFGYFTNRDTDDMAKTFLTVAAQAHEDVFAIVSDHNVIGELEAEEQTVVMFKRFDDNRVKYNVKKFTEDAFKTWVVLQRVPVLVEYSEVARRERYGVRYEHCLELFLSKIRRCPPCKELEPINNKLGKHFEEDEDVVIAKIDAYNNEPEDIKIRAYPTIRLYRKNNQVQEYDIGRDRTLEDLIKFVESDGVDGAAPSSEDLPNI